MTSMCNPTSSSVKESVPGGESETVRVTLPDGVNLSEFPRRFIKTWRTRDESETTTRGTSGSTGGGSRE